MDAALQWAKENPILASTVLGMGGGFIRAAMEPTAGENAADIYNAKTQAELAELQGRQNLNSLRGVNVNRLKPTGVFLKNAPTGIINRSMRV